MTITANEVNFDLYPDWANDAIDDAGRCVVIMDLDGLLALPTGTIIKDCQGDTFTKYDDTSFTIEGGDPGHYGAGEIAHYYLPAGLVQMGRGDTSCYENFAAKGDQVTILEAPFNNATVGLRGVVTEVRPNARVLGILAPFKVETYFGTTVYATRVKVDRPFWLLDALAEWELELLAPRPVEVDSFELRADTAPYVADAEGIDALPVGSVIVPLDPHCVTRVKTRSGSWVRNDQASADLTTITRMCYFGGFLVVHAPGE